MIPILKVVERLQAHEGEAAEKIGIGFALAATEAARYLVEQGEKIVDLEQELAAAKSEREYFRSRAAFFAEVAGATDKILSVKSRPQAEWEPRTDAIGFVRCSNCRDCNTYDEWPDGKKWNFCPNCGAEMKKEVKA